MPPQRPFGRGRPLLLLLTAALIGACEGRPEETEPPPQRRIPVTTATAEPQQVEVVEESIGYIETETAPLVAAEVAGRLTGVEVDVGDTVTAGQVLARVDAQDYRNEARATRAEVGRLEALVANQQRIVERFRSLGRDRFVSETALDEAEAQLKALTEQLDNARARADITQRSLTKTTVTAPVPGIIQQRLVSEGTYVAQGQALFQIATRDALRIHLPFPETVLGQLARGQKVYLTTPTAPGDELVGKLNELRPMVGTGNRAGEAIVQVRNPGNWAPGASVAGRVVIATRRSVTVPDVAVVLRPAGRVVYVLNGDGTVRQSTVEVGVRLAGRLEIRSGLEAGETVAVDGAHYLTDGAAVELREEDGA